jgi:DNA repair exonuclease SbcCD ATPase subunit
MIDYLNSQNTSSSEKNDYSEKIDDLNQQIKECEETFKLNNEKLLSKKEKIDGFDIKKFKVEKEDYKTKYLDAFSKVKYYSKQKETIDEGKCEKCHQDISDDYREKFYKANDDLEKVWREKSDEFKSKIEENERVIEKYENFLQKIHSLESNQKFLNEKINDLKDKVDSYQELQEKEEQKDEGIDKKLKEVNKEIKELNLSLSENRKERDNLNVAITMMKDDGIKSVLIDNYIPIFNNIINSYLEKFNLFISFELDSQFNETIKSRYRDKFSYNSFSEGEKSRINLAILLAFRHITQMNNNINCDLLIIDELVDNIDSDNVNSVLDCIGSVEGINNIFISHNPDIKSHTIFDRTIKVEKIKGFSEYEVQ